MTTIDPVDQLAELAELHRDGVLDDEAFARGKALLLAPPTGGPAPDRAPAPPTTRGRARLVAAALGLLGLAVGTVIAATTLIDRDAGPPVELSTHGPGAAEVPRPSEPADTTPAAPPTGQPGPVGLAAPDAVQPSPTGAAAPDATQPVPTPNQTQAATPTPLASGAPLPASPPAQRPSHPPSEAPIAERPTTSPPAAVQPADPALAGPGPGPTAAPDRPLDGRTPNGSLPAALQAPGCPFTPGGPIIPAWAGLSADERAALSPVVRFAAGLNTDQYACAHDALSPAYQRAYAPDFPTWVAQQSSSDVIAYEVVSLRLAGATAALRARWTSTQDTAHSPAASGETCSVWSLDYTLARDAEGVWRFDDAHGQWAPRTACG